MNLEADTLLAQSESKYIAPIDIALLYIHTGNLDNVIYTGVYPEFTIIHDEPRFQDLLRKLNLPYKN